MPKKYIHDDKLLFLLTDKLKDRFHILVASVALNILGLLHILFLLLIHGKCWNL